MQTFNVTASQQLAEGGVNKVAGVKTGELTQDTYYFKAGQVLDWHRHPDGDQIFFVHAGQGAFSLDDGAEKTMTLNGGMVVLAPKGVWHRIVADTEMIVSQATRQPAGMEKR